jgi:F-type H+-transporting ATPase subunit b
LIAYLLTGQLIFALLAASGGDETTQAIWKVINFAVFVAFMIYILIKKVQIGKVFNDRGASIVKELEQARREKQEADKQLAEVEARLGRLDQEIVQLKADAEREAQREAERIRQAAEVDAEKIRQSAQREIEGAMKAARTELRAFVADKSVELAESIIKKEIGPQDNSRILSKYVDELSGVGK